MSLDVKFKTAARTYRGAVLEAIDKLETFSPFAATTLACCAIDLLSHSLFQPVSDNVEECYKKTVRTRLDGYKTERLAQVVYDLRCGLVHEFRTGMPYGNVLLSDQFDSEPYPCGANVIVSTTHFCRKVREAFDTFFATEDVPERRAFVERAYLFVTSVKVPRLQLADDPSLRTFKLTNTTLMTAIPASGSNVAGIYLPADDELDAEELLRAFEARYN